MKTTMGKRKITFMSCENNKKSRNLLGSSSSMVTMNMVGMGEDTIAEIFMWLPVKSLVKFKVLSKRWFSLISHKDSFFRNRFFSTMGSRTRNRIVGTDDSHPIVLGSIVQKIPPHMFGYLYWSSNLGSNICREEYEKPQYLAATCGELVNHEKEHMSTIEEEEDEEDDDDDVQHNQLHPAAAAAAAAKLCPFTLDGPTDFLLPHLPPDQWREIAVAASSNGFLLCSLGRREAVGHHYLHYYLLANPVTKEWAFLPKPNVIGTVKATSLVCRGEYPLLALVKYTIVRLVSTSLSENLVIEILSDDDNQWTKVELETFGPKFESRGRTKLKTVVTSTYNAQGCGGITVYCLVPTPYFDNATLLCFNLMPTDKKLRDDQRKLQATWIQLPMQIPKYINSSHHLEQVDGAIHYVQVCGKSLESLYLYVWVLGDNKRSWSMKHKLCMGNMLHEAPWTYEYLEGESDIGEPRVECFHPFNPKLILVTLFDWKVWCNMETKTLEPFAEDFVKPELSHAAYFHYTYQWPCWPPLL